MVTDKRKVTTGTEGVIHYISLHHVMDYVVKSFISKLIYQNWQVLGYLKIYDFATTDESTKWLQHIILNNTHQLFVLSSSLGMVACRHQCLFHLSIPFLRRDRGCLLMKNVIDTNKYPWWNLSTIQTPRAYCLKQQIPSITRESALYLTLWSAVLYCWHWVLWSEYLVLT